MCLCGWTRFRLFKTLKSFCIWLIFIFFRCDHNHQSFFFVTSLRWFLWFVCCSCPSEQFIVAFRGINALVCSGRSIDSFSPWTVCFLRAEWKKTHTHITFHLKCGSGECNRKGKNKWMKLRVLSLIKFNGIVQLVLGFRFINRHDDSQNNTQVTMISAAHVLNWRCI